MRKSASSRSSARSSKSRRIESQSSNLFLVREPLVLLDRAVIDSREIPYFCGPPPSLPPLFPDRLPETRRARFVSQPLSLWRSCQTPVKTTTVPWSIGAAPTRASPLVGLKTIRSPTGFSPDHNCARPRGEQDSSPAAKPTVRSLTRSRRMTKNERRYINKLETNSSEALREAGHGHQTHLVLTKERHGRSYCGHQRDL
jgi:hypothetical protein